jgi:head-tail adaptor
MKREFIICLALIVILSILPVYALTASISNPRMVLYKNITNDKLVFQNSVIVNNKNDYEVNISITPKEIWADRIKVSEPEFVIGAGERKEVSYEITIEEQGHYQGDILVLFRTDKKEMVAVAQDLEVFAIGKDSAKTKFANYFLLKIFGALILIILIIIMITKLKRK